MSSRYSSRRKTNERSPFKQKLQTNAPGYEKCDSRKTARQPRFEDDKRDPSHISDLLRTSKEKALASDSADNDTCSGSGRPEVLSIDSDFDSGNCLTESPDQEPCSPTLTYSKIGQGSHFSSGEPRPVLGTSKPTDLSFCTPPARMVTAVSRVPNRKKAVEAKKREDSVSNDLAGHNVNVDPVSGSYKRRAQGLYARSAVNEQTDPTSQAFRLPSTGTGHSSLGTVAASGSKSAGEGKSSDDGMDMKFTDLTHQQLKRSLDQIHGQHELRTLAALSNCNGDGSHFVNGLPKGVFGPHSMGDVASGISAVPPVFGAQFSRAGCVQTFPRNGFTYDACEQPSKYDAILKVKDAMLQEKESVILKLRLQIASLDHQVQETDMALRQVVHTKSTNVTYSSGKGGAYSDIAFQKKIHNLEETLGKAEYQLSELKSKSDGEKNRLEEKIASLETSIKSRDQALADNKKKQKTTAERLEKYKKRVESLERYLGDLPTLEESNKLKTEADLLGEERENLAYKLTELEERLRNKTLLLKDKDYVVDQHTEKENAYLKQIKHLEAKVVKLEKAKTELGRTERDELEDLKFEVERLRSEQESASRMISAYEKRMKHQHEKQDEEIAKYQQKLEEAQDLNEHLRREQFLKQQNANKVHTAMMSLSSQNQELMEQKLDLQEKVKKLEKSQSSAEDESLALSRLHRETSAAVQELKSVTQVLFQTVEGTDPNLSALLGLRNDHPSLSVDSTAGPDSADGAVSVVQTNISVTEVRKVRKDLDQLRTMITNRYADNIGDNCTTQ